MEKHKLIEMGTLSRGRSQHRPRNDSKLFGGKYPFIQTGDVKNANLYIEKYSQTYNDFGLSQSKLWPENTLCITIAANIADTGILSFPACFPDSIIGFTATKGKTDVRYVKYCFDLFQKSIQNMSKGSTQDNLSMEKLEQLEFNYPNFEEQQKIAALLSSLDDKIALNNRINAKLEQMAKRLYDYWFVQFDFPGADGKPYKSNGGRMVWNEELKREIPEGWEVKKIDPLCKIVDCLHSKKPDYCYENENYYLLSLENITKDGYIDLSEKYYISKKDYDEWTSRICVQQNDFLFTNAGRAGDMGMIPAGVKCAIGRNITSVRPEKINPYYLRCFFKSLYMQEQILRNLDKGCFFLSFNVRSIKLLNILTPPSNISEKFIGIVEPIIKQIEINNAENAKLSKERDKLLPLLMNGQVVVE